MKKRLLCALLIVACLAPLFYACGAKTAEEDPGIFAGEEVPLPDGWRPVESVAPFLWENEISLLCSARGEGYAVFTLTLSEDGSADAPDPEETGSGEDGSDRTGWAKTETVFRRNEASSLFTGALTENALFLVTAEGDGRILLTKISRSSPDAQPEYCALSDYFGGAAADPLRFGVYAAAADDAGNCAISGGNVILCLDADFGVRFSVSHGGEALGLQFDSSGGLMAWFPGEDVFRLLDEKTGAVKKSIPGASRAKKLLRTAGGELYFTDPTGVRRLSENGEHGLLLDYLNSNLTAQTAAVLGILDDSTVLLLRSGAEDHLCLYRRSDTPVSWSTTLEIAVTRESPVLSNAVRVFNARHGDVHITVTDYGQYETNDDWQAGQKRLALDLTTGVYRPDIIFAPATDIEMQTAIRQNYYIDLMPYFERDDTLNASSVFGAAIRSVGDEKGGLWGMCCEFSASTLVSTRSLLERYGVPRAMLGEEGLLPARSWTLDEMLDFLEALPDGVLPLYNLTAENASNLTGSGFAAFIDFENMTCDFSSPTFVRFLRYLTTLPRNMEELEKTSEFWQLPDGASAERGAFFTDGRIAMRTHFLSKIDDFTQLEALFNAKDTVAVGYPTAGDYGINVQPMDSFLVTTYCSDPAAAWELIKIALTTPLTNSRGQAEWSFTFTPSYKQAFLDLAEKQKQMTTVCFFGGSPRSTSDPELAKEWIRELENGKPGLLLPTTDEDIAEACELFDSIGEPWMIRLDDAVRAIIDEEISDMLGGMTTPGDCAAKIQSRVKIWLAEHQ